MMKYRARATILHKTEVAQDHILDAKNCRRTNVPSQPSLHNTRCSQF